jgi:hypothetical protein
MITKTAIRKARVFAIAIAIICFLSSTLIARAAAWNGIEPLKSRREEVLKILGKPVREIDSGALQFQVAGGAVIISFVDEKFINAKKLRSELLGTVLEIVLQHDGSSETPETLKLSNNKSFIRDATNNAAVFRNPRDGIVYTFVNGKLRTTRYTFSDTQLGRARK